MRYIFLLAIFFSTIAKGQVTSFFQGQFKGGVTGCGYGPGYDVAGTGTLTINIAPHSSIYKAWLFAGREGEAAPVTVMFNGTSLTFSSSNQVSNTFESPNYGGASAVHGIDVTSLIDSAVNSYSLYVPQQNGGSDEVVYTDFYLYVAYTNNSLPSVTGCIFLNDADFGTDVVDQFNLNYPIENAYAAGLAVCMGYSCSSGDDEGVYINGTYLGSIYGPNENSGLCTGPYGDFAYQNQTLSGLLDCNANEAMNGPDALSNFQLLVSNCATGLTATFTHGDEDNALWAFFITYASGGAPYSFDTAVCTGSPVQLNTNATGTVTWSPSNNLSCNGCAAPVATPAASTTYIGTFSICNATVSDTFNIVENTAAPFTVQANPAEVCAGDTVYLSVTGDSSVTWSSIASLSCTVCGNPFSVPASSQEYYASSACGIRDSVAVTVYSLPTVRISADTNIICPFDSVLICADTGFASYAWSSSQTNACIYSNQAGNYNVTVTDAHGCRAPSNSFSLLVIPGPVPYNFDTSVCPGMPVQLNTNALDSVLWSPAINLTCGHCANPLATPLTNATYTGSFISCNSTLSDTFVISIHNTSLSLQANPSAICTGDTVYLSAGGDSVNWSSSAALSCAVCSNPYSVPDTSLVYYASAVCTGTDSIAVTVYPLPVVHVGADTDRICSDDSLLICATSGFANYAWNTGQSGICIYTSYAGNYYLTATDNHGCVAQSNHFSLSVSPAPSISASVSGDTLTVYNGAMVQWYFDGQPIPGATSPVYIAHGGGTYAVQVTDTNGCQSLSNGLIISSVNDITGYNINIYPNPIGDYVMVDFDPACAGGIVILEDITGRKILQTHLTASPRQLPVADLPPGVYVISLVVNGQVGTKLMIKN